MSDYIKGLMRLGLLSGLASALVAAVAIAAFGQVSQVTQSQMHDPDYPAPYNSSQADRSLKAFDEGHPLCALWTDWHKLCSRTGPDGSTYCRTDSLFPARASAVFCVRDFSQTKPEQTSAEVVSRNRFSHVEKNPCGRSSGVSCFAPPTRVWIQMRPFGGRYLGQMEHPSCVVWNIYNKDGSREMCAEDGRSTMQSCKSSKFTSHTQPYPYVCAEFSRHYLCPAFQKNIFAEKIRGLSGLNYYNLDVETSNGLLMQTKTEVRANGSPVWGIYCRLK